MSFVHTWFLHSWGYFLSILPWLCIGIGISYILKRNIKENVVKRFLGKSSFASIIIAEIAGALSPISILALIPLAAIMVEEGANPATLTAFLLAARAYNPEALPVSLTLLGPTITFLNILVIFTAVTTCSLFIRFATFRIPPSTNKDNAFFKNVITILGYVVLGVCIAGLITTILPPATLAAYGGNNILSIFLAILFGFFVYLGFVGYFPIAKAFLDLGVNHAALITFLSSCSIINLTFLLMFVPVIGKRNTMTILITYLAIILIFGIALFALHI